MSQRKPGVLKILNPIIGILLVNQVVMGLLRGRLPREAFEVLHEGGGIVLTVMVAFHVILNWNWVKANFIRRSEKDII